MLTVLFWTTLVLILYIYIGYPSAVALAARVVRRRIRKSPWIPSVSIVIPAYNEGAEIARTIENKLQLDYPKDCLEILVISDGSTDQTDEIVRAYAAQGVRLIRQDPRQGKTQALNRAAVEAKGEFLVFSDANSLYLPDALRHLTANFADPEVGYVTGRMIYRNPDGSSVGDGCSAYIRYENRLREAETRLGSVVGVNGGIDAVRRSLYEPMRVDQQPDFVLPLKVVARGYRVVYDPAACLVETALTRSEEEYRMRVRVSLRALHAIWDMRGLMNPIRYGLFAWQFISHKVLRYGAFFLLAVLLLINAALAPTAPIYEVGLWLQLMFYFGAASGWTLSRRGKVGGLLYLPFYFSLLNVASAHAFIRMLFGKRQVLWQPRGG